MMANNSHHALKTVHFIAFVLVIIGALNWGLIGVADFNLVAVIFGDGAIARTIYVLVGLSAVLMLYTEFATMRAGSEHQRPARPQSAPG